MQTHMPPSVTTIWECLYNEVVGLHARWIIYRQLFAHSPERIELLNRCPAAFFHIVHDTLVGDVQLTISKLADPSKSGTKENLTLEMLSKAIEKELGNESPLCDNLREYLKRYCEVSSQIRLRRNKQIAHYDLATSLNPVDGPSRSEIEKALSALRDFMNTVESHFDDVPTAYEHPASHNDGNDLISILKDGFRYAELRESGVISWDDFRKSPFWRA